MGSFAPKLNSRYSQPKVSSSQCEIILLQIIYPFEPVPVNEKQIDILIDIDTDTDSPELKPKETAQHQSFWKKLIKIIS